MEFNGQYLTYEEYKALGGNLDLLPFNLLEYEARRRIDIRTFNRLHTAEEIPQAVKLCIYKMIDKMSSYNQALSTASEKNIASENIDGYSVSYITGKDITNVLDSEIKELNDIMEDYLIGVIVNGQHIMYLGVD